MSNQTWRSTPVTYNSSTNVSEEPKAAEANSNSVVVEYQFDLRSVLSRPTASTQSAHHHQFDLRDLLSNVNVVHEYNNQSQRPDLRLHLNQKVQQSSTK